MQASVDAPGGCLSAQVKRRCENCGQTHAGDTVILAIETSCDETAAAVVRGGRDVLSNVVASQMEIHRKFGGVVPEVASRNHTLAVTAVIEEALGRAEVEKEALDAVAVTYGPGLVGALLVGVAAAKAVAFSLAIPLIGVNHIAGHIYANRLVGELEFPLLALVVSGGHTELVRMSEHGSYQILGQTRDDAVGEAYDKVARVFNLPYPGGPALDQLAQQGEARIPLPRAWLEPDSYDFSFSGLKTAVMQAYASLEVQKRSETQQEGNDALADLAASFQEAAVEVLVEKTVRAAQAYPVKQVLLAGGVAANGELRGRLKSAAQKIGVPLVIPPPALCTDNAAMIGAAAQIQYERGVFASLDLNAVPGLSL